MAAYPIDALLVGEGLMRGEVSIEKCSRPALSGASVGWDTATRAPGYSARDVLPKQPGE